LSTEKHYEMLWDCQFCGTEKLLGKTHRFCPNCGSAQDPDARYFPPDDEKVAVEDHQYVGRDVHCPACNSLNSASAEHCGNCGAPLEGAQKASVIEEGTWMGDQQKDDYDQSRDVGREARERDLKAAGISEGGEDSDSGGGLRLGLIIGAVVAVLVVGGFFFLFNQTEEETVVVTGHTWSRTISVETYQRTEDEDWEDNIPAAAYNESCRQRQRDTERVQDGQTCETVRRDNGDGTFTERQECEPTYREEAVMDTWCEYDIDTWEADESITTTGSSTSPAPEWGDTDFQCSGPRLGCQREASRDETYTVLFEGDGETYRCSFPQDEWATFTTGSRWAMEVRQFAGGAVCSSLEAR